METKINSYRDLIVWKKAMLLASEVYKFTSKLPAEEKFGLTSQMRRSAVSIASNIAEGCYRSSRKDYRNFILIAFGSGAELETQIEITNNLGLVSEKELLNSKALLNEIMPMLNKLAEKLNS